MHGETLYAELLDKQNWSFLIDEYVLNVEKMGDQLGLELCHMEYLQNHKWGR
jgi:hypothetical protein